MTYAESMDSHRPIPVDDYLEVVAESRVWRKTDILEEGWADFLELNQDSTVVPARANAAVNRAEDLRWILDEHGLGEVADNDQSQAATLLNDTIDYLARLELRHYYEAEGVANARALDGDFLTSQRRFRNGVMDYVSRYPSGSKTKAYSGIVGVIDYAGIIVNGPVISKQKRKTNYSRLRGALPSKESRIALQPGGWAYRLIKAA